MGRSTEARAALDRAVGAVDRELAANLELTSLFDQTRQAFVLENGQWRLHGSTIERELPRAHPVLAELYDRIPAAEAAMERRGPANTLADDDREVVERWEGDAREAQRLLRADAARPAAGFFGRLIARLLGRKGRA